MKIHSGQMRPGSLKKAEADQKGSSTKKGSKTGSAASADAVSVSDEARTLSKARGPETPDPARIERLRDAIRRGEFKVDAERIAERMLLEER